MLYGLIADAASQKTTAEWLALMDERDIPCGRVNTLADLFSEPHLSAVGLFEAVAHPTEGELRAIRSPFRVAGVDRQPDRAAPPLGDSASAILVEAGFSPAEMEGLIGHGIVRRP
jgi:crotonobetainyl-CoA:carnitine CoA-transferase CaiB-like acyl-CoA transferase